MIPAGQRSWQVFQLPICAGRDAAPTPASKAAYARGCNGRGVQGTPEWLGV